MHAEIPRQRSLSAVSQIANDSYWEGPGSPTTRSQAVESKEPWDDAYNIQIDDQDVFKEPAGATFSRLQTFVRRCQPTPGSIGSFQVGVRAGCSVIIASLFLYVKALHGTRPFSGQASSWIIVTVLIVQEKTATESLRKCINRLLGTTVGALLAFGLGSGFVGNTQPWAHYVHGLVFFAVVFFWFGSLKGPQPPPWLQQFDYAVTLGIITFGLTFATMLGGKDNQTVALDRIAAILVGIIIAGLCCAVIFPVTTETELRGLISSSLGVLSRNIQTVSDFASAEATAHPAQGGSDPQHGLDTYDYRTDKVHAVTTAMLAKIYGRGQTLITAGSWECLPRLRRAHGASAGDGRAAYVLVWRWRPTQELSLVLRDIRRMGIVVSMINPYLQHSVFIYRWGAEVLQHLRDVLDTVAGVVTNLHSSMERGEPVHIPTLLRQVKRLHRRHLEHITDNVAQNLEVLKTTAARSQVPPPEGVVRERTYSGATTTSDLGGLADTNEADARPESGVMFSAPLGGKELRREMSAHTAEEVGSSLRAALGGVACLELVLRLIFRTQQLLRSLHALEMYDPPP